jgi:two-component sensor histidine kinase
LNQFLIRRIVEHPRRAWAQAAVGLGCAALAVALRQALTPVVGGGAPFIAFIPAVLAASAFGGVRAGLWCLAVLAAIGAVFYAPPVDPRFALPRRVFGEVAFVASGAFIVWITGLLHAALRQETAARETERLLRAELQHRVKNTLAVVQSLANQTLRAPADRETLSRDFTDRLITLASTHDLLDAAGWRDVTMSALAAATLAPFLAARDAQVRMAGEDFTVPPEQAVTLALCLNELATNAAKHGALGGADGVVELTWDVREAEGARVATVAWAERGGPPVQPPAADGFGARLLRRGLGPRSRARAELAFAPDGVRWRTEFALKAAGG